MTHRLLILTALLGVTGCWVVPPRPQLPEEQAPAVRPIATRPPISARQINTENVDLKLQVLEDELTHDEANNLLTRSQFDPGDETDNPRK